MRDINHNLEDERGGTFHEEKIDLLTWGLIAFLIVGIFAGIVIANHFGFNNLITN